MSSQTTTNGQILIIGDYLVGPSSDPTRVRIEKDNECVEIEARVFHRYLHDIWREHAKAD